MSLQIDLKYTVDLAAAAESRVMRGVLFRGDANAHVVRVSVERYGVPVPLDGVGVSAYFCKADGETILLNGTVSGNEALVIMPDLCYAVPGPFRLFVKGSGENVRQVLLCVVGNVEPSITDLVVTPGEPLPDMETLIAQMAAINAELAKLGDLGAKVSAVSAAAAATEASAAAAEAYRQQAQQHLDDQVSAYTDTARGYADAAELSSGAASVAARDAAQSEADAAAANTAAQAAKGAAEKALADLLAGIADGAPEFKGPKGDKGDPATWDEFSAAQKQSVIENVSAAIGTTDKTLTLTDRPADAKTVGDALDGKAASVHGHAVSDVTGLQDVLDGKSNTGHSHVVSDVSGLQSAIDGAVAGKADDNVVVKTINDTYTPVNGNVDIPFVDSSTFDGIASTVQTNADEIESLKSGKIGYANLFGSGWQVDANTSLVPMAFANGWLEDKRNYPSDFNQQHGILLTVWAYSAGVGNENALRVQVLIGEKSGLWVRRA